MASPAPGGQYTFSHIDPYQCGKSEGEHRAVGVPGRVNVFRLHIITDLDLDLFQHWAGESQRPPSRGHAIIVQYNYAGLGVRFICWHPQLTASLSQPGRSCIGGLYHVTWQKAG
jgi:hypothetical protein